MSPSTFCGWARSGYIEGNEEVGSRPLLPQRSLRVQTRRAGGVKRADLGLLWERRLLQ